LPAQLLLAEQVGDIAEAEKLYHLAMKSDLTDASAPFNLGNMLRGRGEDRRSRSGFSLPTRVPVLPFRPGLAPLAVSFLRQF
jgi:hypothetical protein